MKLYILNRIAYGDFDISYETPVFASTNKAILVEKKRELNEKLTKEEISRDVSYEISPNTVKML